MLSLKLGTSQKDQTNLTPRNSFRLVAIVLVQIENLSNKVQNQSNTILTQIFHKRNDEKERLKLKQLKFYAQRFELGIRVTFHKRLNSKNTRLIVYVNLPYSRL